MKPLEILSELPYWAKASPEEILDSPAFAMPCRLGDESVLLRPAPVEPAASDMLALSVSFGDEPHALCLARSPRFPDLDKLWDSRADVPEPILLALVEKECGSLFQMLENAVRKQLRLVGVENVSRRGAAESVANWELARGTGDVGSDGNILNFSLTRTSTVVSALGVMRNLDLAHESIRLQKLPAEVEYAAFQLPDADLASLAPGDALLLPEIGAVAPRRIVGGRFAVDANGVSPYQEDEMCRVRDAADGMVSLGELFDAATGTAGAQSQVPPANAQLRLVRRGKTLATGRLDRLGDSQAFIVETPHS